MKKLYHILLIVLLICVTGTVLFLILSPDRVPMHFNAAGEPDRIGSKYENVMWPLLAGASVLLFLLLARREKKKEGQTNAKVFLIAGVCLTALFTALGFFFMWKAAGYDPQNAANISYDDVNRFVSIGVGVLMVVLGNIMPKAQRNSLFGVRTQWSMASDDVWQKSQRFGGVALVIAGFVLILLSLFLPGLWNTIAMIAVLAVAAILSARASYRYYREAKEKQQG